MSDIRTLNYENLTNQEAFDVWLSECPVDYDWQDDVDIDDGCLYVFYSFKVYQGD